MSDHTMGGYTAPKPAAAMIYSNTSPLPMSEILLAAILLSNHDKHCLVWHLHITISHL